MSTSTLSMIFFKVSARNPLQKVAATLSILTLCILSNCGQEPMPIRLDTPCADNLQEKDLAGIKKCVQGNWKIEYTKGQSGPKYLATNSYVSITETDSMYYFWDGRLFAESPVVWTLDQTLLTFTNLHDLNIKWDVESISNDTLMISQGGMQMALTSLMMLPATDCQGSYWNMGLNKFRQCLLGKWQLHYRDGGFPRKKFYNTDEVIMNFRAGDSLDYITNGVYSARRKIEWEKTMSPSDEVSFVFKYTTLNGSQKIYGLGGIYQDSLSLYEDGYRFALTRK